MANLPTALALSMTLNAQSGLPQENADVTGLIKNTSESTQIALGTRLGLNLLQQGVSYDKSPNILTISDGSKKEPPKKPPYTMVAKNETKTITDAVGETVSSKSTEIELNNGTKIEVVEEENGYIHYKDPKFAKEAGSDMFDFYLPLRNGNIGFCSTRQKGSKIELVCNKEIELDTGLDLLTDTLKDLLNNGNQKVARIIIEGILGTDTMKGNNSLHINKNGQKYIIPAFAGYNLDELQKLKNSLDSYSGKYKEVIVVLDRKVEVVISSKRADDAKQRADDAKQRADDAKQRADDAKELNGILRALNGR